MRRAESIFRTRPTLVAALVLLVGGVALLSSALLSGKVLAAEDVLLYQSPFAPALQPKDPPSNQFLFDSFYQLHPDMLVVRDALRSHQIPGWSPYQGGGEPLLASQQHAMLSPFNWLLTVAPFWQSLEWVALLKLIVAGLGLYLLLVALGLRRSAALLGAVAFMLSAPMINWLSHPHVNVYAVMPWLLLAAERLARSGGWRDALWVAVAMAFVVLGGHPPSMVIVASVAFPWFVYRWLVHGRALGVLGKFAGGVVLGMLVGAVVELPLIELSGQSYNIARGGGGGPKSILFGFVSPELWGRPDKFEIAGGPSNYLERTGYFGVLPLLFAAVGFARRPRGPQIFFAVAAVIALALVVKVPLLTSLFGGLPGIDEVNRSRYLVVCAFGGAALAAYGADALFELERRRALVALGLAALVALIPLAWVVKHHDVLSSFGAAAGHVLGIGHAALPRPELQLAAFMRWALFGVIGVALVALAAWRPRVVGWIAVAAVAVTLFDLVAYERGFQPAIPLAEADPPTPEAIKAVRAELGNGRVAGHQELGPNVAERYGLRDARVYRSPQLERRGKLWAALGGEGPEYETLPPTATKLSDIYGVSYQMSYELQADKSGAWRAQPVAPLVERTKPTPRAQVVYSWATASGVDDAVAKVVARSKAVIEGVPARGGGGDPTPAQFVKDGDQSLELRVNAKQPGQLILADTYYPGWQAKVDGHDATIHPANATFRAVAVPAGQHTVTFDYKPASIRIGAILSLLAAIVLITGFVLTRRPRLST